MAQIDIKTIEKLPKERNTVHETVYMLRIQHLTATVNIMFSSTPMDVAIENSREK